MYYRPISTVERGLAYATQHDLLGPLHIAFDPHMPDAYYSGTLEMHKSAPSMRFLACSQACPSTRMSLMATAILQLLTNTFR